ncbi:MAG: pentapeptide repeat-containing protein [Actinobacteria bacterium]|nr:pentapeptide repeat-containing protein [Actinomycetota bacterium]
MDSKEPHMTTVYPSGNRWGRWLALILALGILIFLVLWTMGDLPDRIAKWDAFGDDPAEGTIKWIRLVLLAVLGASIGALGVQAWRWWPRSRPRVVEIPRYERHTDLDTPWGTEAAQGSASSEAADTAAADQHKTDLATSTVSDSNPVIAHQDEKIPVYDPAATPTDTGSAAIAAGNFEHAEEAVWSTAELDTDDDLYDDPLIVHPRTTNVEVGALRVVGDTTVSATGGESQAVTESAERSADESPMPSTLIPEMTTRTSTGDQTTDNTGAIPADGDPTAENAVDGSAPHIADTQGAAVVPQLGAYEAAAAGPVGGGSENHAEAPSDGLAWSSLERAIQGPTEDAYSSDFAESAASTADPMAAPADSESARPLEGVPIGLEGSTWSTDADDDSTDDAQGAPSGQDHASTSGELETDARTIATDGEAASDGVTSSDHSTSGDNSELPISSLTFDLPEASLNLAPNGSPFGSSGDLLANAGDDLSSNDGTSGHVPEISRPEITWTEASEVAQAEIEAEPTHTTKPAASDPADLVDVTVLPADETRETHSADTEADSANDSSVGASQPTSGAAFSSQETVGASDTETTLQHTDDGADDGDDRAEPAVSSDVDASTKFEMGELEALVFNTPAEDASEQISSDSPAASVFPEATLNEDESHFSTEVQTEDVGLASVAELHEKRASRERAPMSTAPSEASQHTSEDAELNTTTQPEVPATRSIDRSAPQPGSVSSPAGHSGKTANADPMTINPKPLSDVLSEIGPQTEETGVSLSKAECAALLQRSNLQGIDFNLVDFSGLTLRGVDMSGSSLRSASLEGTDLRGSRLIDVDLTGVLAKGSFLRGVRLEGARMAGVDLTDSDMGGVYAPTLDMHGAMLSGASLRGAILPQAELSGADLAGVDAQGADLGEAALVGASLQGAVLRGANLQGTDLRGADLRGADVRGADLAGANLRGTDLEGAFSDSATRWPEGVEPDAEGVRIAERHTAAAAEAG